MKEDQDIESTLPDDPSVNEKEETEKAHKNDLRKRVFGNHRVLVSSEFTGKAKSEQG